MEQIPIADVTIQVSIESFDPQNQLVLVKPVAPVTPPAILTMNRANILEEIIVASNHAITSAPISNTNSRIVLQPLGQSPYERTTIELELIDLEVDTSNKFALKIVTVS